MSSDDEREGHDFNGPGPDRWRRKNEDKDMGSRTNDVLDMLYLARNAASVSQSACDISKMYPEASKNKPPTCATRLWRLLEYFCRITSSRVESVQGDVSSDKNYSPQRSRFETFDKKVREFEQVHKLLDKNISNLQSEWRASDGKPATLQIPSASMLELLGELYIWVGVEVGGHSLLPNSFDEVQEYLRGMAGTLLEYEESEIPLTDLTRARILHSMPYCLSLCVPNGLNNRLFIIGSSTTKMQGFPGVYEAFKAAREQRIGAAAVEELENKVLMDPTAKEKALEKGTNGEKIEALEEALRGRNPKWKRIDHQGVQSFAFAFYKGKKYFEFLPQCLKCRLIYHFTVDGKEREARNDEAS